MIAQSNLHEATSISTIPMEPEFKRNSNSTFFFHVFDLSYSEELHNLREELKARNYENSIAYLKEMRAELVKADSALLKDVEFFRYLDNFSNSDMLKSSLGEDKWYLLLEIDEILEAPNEQLPLFTLQINDLYYKWRNPLFEGEWFYCSDIFFSTSFLNFLETNAPITWVNLYESYNLQFEDYMFYEDGVGESLQGENDFNFFHLSKEKAKIMKEELSLVTIPDDKRNRMQLKLFIQILENAAKGEYHVAFKRTY